MLAILLWQMSKDVIEAIMGCDLEKLNQGHDLNIGGNQMSPMLIEYLLAINTR